MHCVAGDGVGILAGAVMGALVAMPQPSREKIAVAAVISFAVLFIGMFLGYAGRG
jgi:uncharacterized membrane protein YqgA involved in biofilm formation